MKLVKGFSANFDVYFCKERCVLWWVLIKIATNLFLALVNKLRSAYSLGNEEFLWPWHITLGSVTVPGDF